MTFDVPALKGSGRSFVLPEVLSSFVCHSPSLFVSLMRLAGIVVSILMRVVGAEALSSRLRLRNCARMSSSSLLLFVVVSLLGMIVVGVGVIVL